MELVRAFFRRDDGSSIAFRYNSKMNCKASQPMTDKKEMIVNWDQVVHKNVRSVDNQPVGNIVAILGDSMHVETAGSRGQYLIPKEHVARFNGAEVVLDMRLQELDKFSKP